MNPLQRRKQLALWKPVATERDWSPQQLNVFEWFASGQGNLTVRARAGSGKTTAIIEGIGRASEKSILLAAFNKTIADELKLKLTNPRAEARTLHSLGAGIVRSRWNLKGGEQNDGMDRYRGRKIAAKVLEKGGVEPLREYVLSVHKVVERAKQTLVADLPGLASIAIDLDLRPGKDWEFDLPSLARFAQDALTAAKEYDGTIDFCDQIYLPVVMGWATPKFDLVVIDEAQDMNAAQLRLAQGVAKGRICIVGDDRQAIYGFRGADSGSIDRLKAELQAQELGLTVTYRCPTSVVRLAAELVPDLRAAPNAKHGVVEGSIDVPAIGLADIKQYAAVGDFVLSRTNAPLARVCMGLLRKGLRAKIEGRDVGKQILEHVNRMSAYSIKELLQHIIVWEQEQIEYFEAAIADVEKRAQKIFDLHDYLETLRVLAMGCESMPELVALVHQLFDDDVGADYVVCSTVHRVKGREAERVFLLANTFYPGGRNSPEEENIHYVAVTRSKERLTWCGDLLAMRPDRS